MKKYFEPTMKFHELKSGKIMAASLREADTKDGTNNVEDFEETTVSW